MKKKQEKVATINEVKVNTLGGKKCYMRSTYLSMYLDINNVGV